MSQTKAQLRLHKHHTWLIVCAILLIIFLGIAGMKFIYTKNMWYQNTVKLQEGIKKYDVLNSQEDGKILAYTISTLPSLNLPLFKQIEQLQTFVSGYSTQTARDVVVVDKDKVILADTIPANVGDVYAEDKGGEVGKTMFDGVPREFLEKSMDYPNGISQTVVQIKDKSGTIVGALIVSSSNIFK